MVPSVLGVDSPAAKQTNWQRSIAWETKKDLDPLLSGEKFILIRGCGTMRMKGFFVETFIAFMVLWYFTSDV